MRASPLNDNEPDQERNSDGERGDRAGGTPAVGLRVGEAAHVQRPRRDQDGEAVGESTEH
jgi:hypothetical protein